MKSGFYLCSNDTESVFGFFTGRPKMRYDGGEWTSLSGGYATEDEARERLKIFPSPCSECGRVFSCNFCEPIKSEMEANGICHSCHFWRGYVATKHMKNHAIIGGCHYVIGNEKEPGETKWRGFGGRKSTILFNDGREVVTTNLWFQGEIPEHFLERLPNNAEFNP